MSRQARLTRQELEFLLAMDEAFERERAEGRVEGRVDAVLTVLRGRGIAVPKAASQRIRAQADLRQLQRWLERAIDATSIDEVIRVRAKASSAKARRLASSRARRPRRAAALR